jgi:hypothetical protein
LFHKQTTLRLLTKLPLILYTKLKTALCNYIPFHVFDSSHYAKQKAMLDIRQSAFEIHHPLTGRRVVAAKGIRRPVVFRAVTTTGWQGVCTGLQRVFSIPQRALRLLQRALLSLQRALQKLQVALQSLQVTLPKLQVELLKSQRALPKLQRALQSSQRALQSLQAASQNLQAADAPRQMTGKNILKHRGKQDHTVYRP